MWVWLIGGVVVLAIVGLFGFFIYCLFASTGTEEEEEFYRQNKMPSQRK